MIICIGDSHSSIFSKKNEIIEVWPKKSFKFYSKIKPIRIGAATAYNLKNKIQLINSILDKVFYFKNSYVMFCFGEVDIRAHIIKQASLQNRDVEHLVKECVERYIESLDGIKLRKNINKVVWGPIASWSIEKPYDGPSYGTNLERNYLTRVFNGYLKEKCLEKNIIFVSIFEKMLNSDGTTNSYFLDDLGAGIHLNINSIPLIRTELKKNNLTFL
tara:strand:+ start:1452 stop:2099 length:648 start_codon:yes stop_codon:yes gene_type:complete